jgi:hypothetical protein
MATEDINEPMVGGPYRPVLTNEGSHAPLHGYWIEDVEGLQFTGTRFYSKDEFDDAAALCLLLNRAYTEGYENGHMDASE